MNNLFYSEAHAGAKSHIDHVWGRTKGDDLFASAKVHEQTGLMQTDHMRVAVSLKKGSVMDPEVQTTRQWHDPTTILAREQYLQAVRTEMRATSLQMMGTEMIVAKVRDLLTAAAKASLTKGTDRTKPMDESEEMAACRKEISGAYHRLKNTSPEHAQTCTVGSI